MILTWLLRLLIPHYTVLVENPVTKKPSGKNVFATLSFVVGIGGAVAAIVADIQSGRAVEKTAILLLLGNGSLLAGLKVYQQQANRQTATAEGQPLAAPSPPGEVPPIMPQVPNPNAPDTADPPLAGYTDGPNGLAYKRPTPQTE